MAFNVGVFGVRGNGTTYCYNLNNYNYDLTLMPDNLYWASEFRKDVSLLWRVTRKYLLVSPAETDSIVT